MTEDTIKNVGDQLSKNDNDMHSNCFVCYDLRLETDVSVDLCEEGGSRLACNKFLPIFDRFLV